jgi:hypothetical protein
MDPSESKELVRDAAVGIKVFASRVCAEVIESKYVESVIEVYKYKSVSGKSVPLIQRVT